MFCFVESKDAMTASSEHLLSRPVADTFGIDRTARVARMNADMTELQWTVLNGLKRRCVCTGCHNGWMNRLEHEMATVASWLASNRRERLGADRDRALRFWALKTPTKPSESNWIQPISISGHTDTGRHVEGSSMPRGPRRA